MTVETEAPPIPADLMAIAANADAELAGQALVPGQQPEAAPDRGAELAGMLSLAVAMAEPALPFLPTAYTPEVCQRIGTAFAAVAEKYGWNLSFTDSPELALAVVSVPPTVTAVALGRKYFAEKAAEAERQARASTSSQPAQQPQQPQQMSQADAWNDPGPRPHAGTRVMPSGG